MKPIEMLDELNKHRSQLECDLSAFIRHRLQQFYEETGLSPDSISINMVERRVLHEHRSRRYFNGVDVSLSI